MKSIPFLLFTILLLGLSVSVRAEGPVVLVADAGEIDAQPSWVIDESQASLEMENGEGIAVLQGSYYHPYSATDFQIVWQPGVDVQRSSVETSAEIIRFLVHFIEPVSSNAYQKVFTAKPVYKQNTSSGIMQYQSHPIHCTWIEAAAINGEGKSLPVKTHTDPVWWETDYGVPFSVYVSGFPAAIEKLLLTEMDGTEFYPLVEMVRMDFEPNSMDGARFINPGALVVGISASPYFPLSFIVQTVDGKRYAFNDLPRENLLDPMRLVYSPSAVGDWECY